MYIVSDDVDDIITKATTIITLHIISVTLKSTLVKARHGSSSYTVVDSFSVIFHNFRSVKTISIDELCEKNNFHEN